jgi:hypothetical protein
MKRIVRLTESDLARIVKRVINEQSKTPIVDAGRGEGKYLVVMSNPTIKAMPKKPQYPNVVFFRVDFNGMVMDSSGQNKGSRSTMYGGCGTWQSGNSTNETNPSTLYDYPSSVIEGGLYFRFGYGKINTMTREFCSSQGKTASSTIQAGESYKFEAQNILNKVNK